MPYKPTATLPKESGVTPDIIIDWLKQELPGFAEYTYTKWTIDILQRGTDYGYSLASLVETHIKQWKGTDHER